MIDGFKVSRVLMDNGSTVNVLFVSPYKKLERPKWKLILDHEPLLSFLGDITQPLGSDQLELRLQDGNYSKTINTYFTVVDAPSSYNAILGRPVLNWMRAIIAGFMFVIKFPTPQGTCTIRGCRQVTRDCNAITTQRIRVSFEVLSLQKNPKPTDKPKDLRDRVMGGPCASWS